MTDPAESPEEANGDPQTSASDRNDNRSEDDVDVSVSRALAEHGLFRWLDLQVEQAESGRIVITVPFDEKFANLTSGTVHGGVTATVMDTASAFALRSTFEDPAAARLTTTDLNVRYLRPARGDLRVDASVLRAGGSMGVTECEATTVVDGEETLVATGGTSYRLFRD